MIQTQQGRESASSIDRTETKYPETPQFVSNIDLSEFVSISGYDILNQSAFDTFAATYKTSGSGSTADPYIFQNLEIVGNMSFSNIGSAFSFRDSYFHGGYVRFENANLKEVSGSVFSTGSESTWFYVQTDTVYENNTFSADGEIVDFRGQTNVTIRNNSFTAQEEKGSNLRIQSYYNGTLVKSQDVSFTDNIVHGAGTVLYSYISGYAEYLRNDFTIDNGYTFYPGMDLIVQDTHNISDNTFTYDGAREYSPQIQIRRISAYPPDLYIMNNTFSNFYRALYFNVMRNIHLIENSFRDCNTGVYFKGVNNENDIRGNSFVNCDLAYYFSSASGNVITESNITSTNIGAIFSTSSDNLFNSTVISSSNWFLYNYLSSSNNTDVGTVATGLQSLGLVLESDQDVQNYVTSNSISGSGTKEDPYLFSGIQMDGGIGIAIDTNYSIYFKDILIKGVSSPFTNALRLTHGNYSILENITIIDAYNGLIIENSLSPTLIGIRVEDINIAGFPVAIDESDGTSIDGLTVDYGYQVGLRILNSDNLTLSNIDIKDTSINSVYVQSSNELNILNSSISGRKTSLFIATVNAMNLIGSNVTSQENLFSTSNVDYINFTRNILSGASKMSVLTDSVEINFEYNTIADNTAELINATGADVLFTNNYFVNNTTPIIGTGGNYNFTANYYSDLSSENMTVIPGVIDTDPLRPSLVAENLSFESGDVDLYSLKPLLPVDLNYTLIYVGTDYLGQITWNGLRVDSVQIDASMLYPTGTYTLLLQTYDIWGISGNQSLEITVSDTTAPAVSNPGDVKIEVGAQEKIVWNIDDINLKEYEIS